jgi:hypothetical protein
MIWRRLIRAPSDLTLERDNFASGISPERWHGYFSTVLKELVPLPYPFHKWSLFSSQYHTFSCKVLKSIPQWGAKLYTNLQCTYFPYTLHTLSALMLICCSYKSIILGTNLVSHQCGHSPSVLRTRLRHTLCRKPYGRKVLYKYEE